MTSYILLRKNNIDDPKDEVISLHVKPTYLLPSNLLSYYSSHGLFEKNLIAWSAQFCDTEKDFLDIGAHTGTYSISLAQRCKNVHAFEPQRMTFYALCGSVALSNMTNIFCHNYGLGAEYQRGKLRLNIISQDGGGSTVQETSSEIIDTEIIEIKTLDDLDMNNIGFIKMDVEDNELNVILGATKTLERNNFPAILFECNDVSSNKGLFEHLSIDYKIIQISGVKNMFLAERNK